ncbi:DUF4184 family protein [Terracidiphilus gabretensis]|uniref:DUF4184 family protein n=1 Tax=Terracidiphilus gabretensis TaxID=1577687 RepID=UPI0009EA4A73|nr:DUF4184 family protein [Terracidiphilus gabretensis]
MPFTPAHAVAALPFRKTRLNLPAMVVGCLSPDFEYFFQLAPQGSFGHTWLGVLVADLPVSLLVLWLYQSYLKAGLYAVGPGLFPFREEGRKAEPIARGAMQWVIVVVSILLGAATHIVWDAFTHKHLWPYDHIAFLRTHFSVFRWRVDMCNFLQTASSVAGMVVLLVMWTRWAGAARQPGMPTVRRLGAVLAAMALLIAVLRTVAMAYLFGKLVLTIIGVVTFLTTLLLLVGLTGAWRRWMPE